MQELETLLTSLVQRGWKPKGREAVSIKLDKEFTKSEGKTIFYCSCKDWFWFYADLRWIVSLESGLWQFVCERWFCRYDENADYRRDKLTIHPLCLDCEEKTLEKNRDSDPEYRLLESALIPEEELGKFLVDNIKLEN